MLPSVARRSLKGAVIGLARSNSLANGEDAENAEAEKQRAQVAFHRSIGYSRPSPRGCQDSINALPPYDGNSCSLLSPWVPDANFSSAFAADLRVSTLEWGRVSGR